MTRFPLSECIDSFTETDKQWTGSDERRDRKKISEENVFLERTKNCHAEKSTPSNYDVKTLSLKGRSH